MFSFAGEIQIKCSKIADDNSTQTRQCVIAHHTRNTVAFLARKTLHPELWGSRISPTYVEVTLGQHCGYGSKKSLSATVDVLMLAFFFTYPGKLETN